MLRIVDLQMSMCDWDNYEEICLQQIAQIKAGGDNVDVFNLQALPVDYAFIGMAARQAAERLAKKARSFMDTRPLVHAGALRTIPRFDQTGARSGHRSDSSKYSGTASSRRP